MRALLSNEHFSVDGTLIESWAAVKSMRRRDGKDEPPGPGRNPTVTWHGEKRSNETHEARKDPEAKLFRKGKGQAAKLNYMGHVLMDHREGLIVDVEVTEASIHRRDGTIGEKNSYGHDPNPPRDKNR